MGVIANKAVIVERELSRAKSDKNAFYSWFFVGGFDEFQAVIKNNPAAWQPTISDVINEIANYYGSSFTEYQAIYDYLMEVNNND